MRQRWWQNSEVRTAGIIILGYLAVGGVLVPDYRFQINPDGLAYLDVAQYYLHGQWQAAINGYWGPLLSWLMIPWLAGGFEPLLAAKLLNLCIGAGVLAAVAALLRPIRRRWLAAATLAAAAAVVTDWALASYITPDLLMALVVLWYVVIIWDPSRYRRHWGWALAAGVLAGIGYLTKSYALPFFVAQAAGWHAWWYWRQPQHRSQWLRRGAVMVAGLVVVALPWTAAISLKYHRPTVGTSGAYNMALAGPDHPGHPMQHDGLFEPAPGSTSAWTDPSVFKVHSWGVSLFGQPHNFRYAGELIDKNWLVMIGLLGQFWVLGVAAALAGATVAASRTAAGSPLRRAAALFWWTGGVYVAGYLLVFVEDRYMWPVNLLLLILSAYLVGELWQLRRYPAWVLVAVTLVGLAAVVRPATDHLALRKGVAQEYAGAANRLELADGACPSLASNGHWDRSLFIAYHAGCPYYGIFAPKHPETTIEQLAQLKVRYVLVWDDVVTGAPPAATAGTMGAPGATTGRATPQELAGYQEIQRLPDWNLRLYEQQ